MHIRALAEPNQVGRAAHAIQWPGATRFLSCRSPHFSKSEVLGNLRPVDTLTQAGPTMQATCSNQKAERLPRQAQSIATRNAGESASCLADGDLSQPWSDLLNTDITCSRTLEFCEQSAAEPWVAQGKLGPNLEVPCEDHCRTQPLTPCSCCLVAVPPLCGAW